MIHVIIYRYKSLTNSYNQTTGMMCTDPDLFAGALTAMNLVHPHLNLDRKEEGARFLTVWLVSWMLGPTSCGPSPKSAALPTPTPSPPIAG